MPNGNETIEICADRGNGWSRRRLQGHPAGRQRPASGSARRVRCAGARWRVRRARSRRDLSLAKIQASWRRRACRLASVHGGGSSTDTASRAKQVGARRRAWFEEQPDLDPRKFVFIDETWASTALARTPGRALCGERLRAAPSRMDAGRPPPSSLSCATPAWSRRWCWCRNYVLATSSSWTIWAATRVQASGLPSRLRARACATSRPTDSTSTQSRMLLPS